MGAPEITTAAQRDVLARYARGQDITAIARDTGTPHDKVTQTIHMAGFDRGRAGHLVRAYDTANPARARGDQLAALPALLRAELRPLVDALTASRPTPPQACDGRVPAELVAIAAGVPGPHDEEILAALRAVQIAVQELTELLPAEPGAPHAGDVLLAYDAYACLDCGSRYSQRYNDHGCGPLVPVTVTVTRRPHTKKGR